MPRRPRIRRPRLSRIPGVKAPDLWSLTAGVVAAYPLREIRKKAKVETIPEPPSRLARDEAGMDRLLRPLGPGLSVRDRFPLPGTDPGSFGPELRGDRLPFPGPRDRFRSPGALFPLRAGNRADPVRCPEEGLGRGSRSDLDRSGRGGPHRGGSVLAGQRGAQEVAIIVGGSRESQGLGLRRAGKPDLWGCSRGLSTMAPGIFSPRRVRERMGPGS
jgi:hypothetical protein